MLVNSETVMYNWVLGGVNKYNQCEWRNYNKSLFCLDKQVIYSFGFNMIICSIVEFKMDETGRTSKVFIFNSDVSNRTILKYVRKIKTFFDLYHNSKDNYFKIDVSYEKLKDFEDNTYNYGKIFDYIERGFIDETIFDILIGIR